MGELSNFSSSWVWFPEHGNYNFQTAGRYTLKREKSFPFENNNCWISCLFFSVQTGFQNLVMTDSFLTFLVCTWGLQYFHPLPFTECILYGHLVDIQNIHRCRFRYSNRGLFFRYLSPSRLNKFSLKNRKACWNIFKGKFYSSCRYVTCIVNNNLRLTSRTKTYVPYLVWSSHVIS